MHNSDWPLQKNCDSFYGDPRGAGGSTVDLLWYHESIVFVTPRWPMVMGDIVITRIAFHRLCAPALEAIFDEIAADEFLADEAADVLRNFGGSFAYRPMRGGTRLSMHSYGCAIDFDPEHNAQHDDKPLLASYPDLVAVFKKHGAVWGGDWAMPDTDGMHFQFARVK